MSIVMVTILIIVITVMAIISSYKNGLFKKYVPKTIETIVSTEGIFKPSPSWSESDYPGEDGKCNLYTRKPTSDGLASVSISSLEKCHDDMLCYRTRPSTKPACIDTDQLYAKKIYRICTNPIGTNAASGCIKSDGTRARINEGEINWVICSSIPICTNQIGLFDFNHRRDNSIGAIDSMCMSSTGKIGGNVSFDICDQSDLSQYFKITRYGLDAKNKPTRISPIGLFAIIKHRVTGNVLIPDLPTDLSGNPSFTTILTRPVGLKFVSPTSKYNGLWWLLVPPLPNPITSTVTPQQIVYIGLPTYYPIFNPINSGTGTGTGTGTIVLTNPYDINDNNNNIFYQGITITTNDSGSIKTLFIYNNSVYFPFFQTTTDVDLITIIKRVINSQFGLFFDSIIKLSSSTSQGGSELSSYSFNNSPSDFIVYTFRYSFVPFKKISDLFLNIQVTGWTGSGAISTTDDNPNRSVDMLTYVENLLSIRKSEDELVLDLYETEAKNHTQFLNTSLFNKIMEGKISDYPF